MKKTLMLVSEKSKHLTEVYNVLCRAQMDVVHIDNICEAKAGLAMHSPAFVLLDFDIIGAAFLLDEIAFGQFSPRPHIMIAAEYRDGNDRAAMLKRGADHCVDSPINTREVLAVIYSVLRRNRQAYTIEHKELIINTSRRTVTMRGDPVALTRKEYEVLCALAHHAGSILTKEEIYRAVWKDSYDPKSTNVSDQISSLSSKLGLSSKDSAYIQTIIGIGYKFGGSMH